MHICLDISTHLVVVLLELGTEDGGGGADGLAHDPVALDDLGDELEALVAVLVAVAEEEGLEHAGQGSVALQTRGERGRG